MRVVSALASGLVVALLVVGLALFPLLHPTFTRLLSERYSEVAMSGLSQAQMLKTAELVRAFVADNDVASLPAQVGGRPGFDAAAVSHLRDVGRVLDAARIATGVLAAVVALGLGVSIARKRFVPISDALIAGAAWCVIIVVLAGVAGASNFDTFFAWFHSLFFSAGTWEFPADSLLIELFPETFWVAAGATWVGLILVGAAVLGSAGWLVRGAETRATAGSPASPRANGA